MKPSVVMKFGGTSVGTAGAIERARSHVLAEKRPAVVIVSALAGVTDLIENALALAAGGGRWRPLFTEIVERHGAAIDGLGIERPDDLPELEKDLRDLLRGVELVREASPRVRDLALSFGERASARIFAAALRAVGARAEAFDSWRLGLATDGLHGRAAPTEDSAGRIRREVEKLPDGVIPVVTGFIARSAEGEITTLGRGGSDYSASLFGAALGVEEIQIWTDVPGFLRADPRIVENPELLSEMTFPEAAELAYFGAKVVHPRTIEPAERAGIDVRVLGTFQVAPGRAKESGTRITKRARPEPVRAIALRRQVRALHVHSLGMLDAAGFLARLFGVLADHGVSVDVVATSEVSVSMTFDHAEAGLDRAIEEISAFATVEPRQERCLLCLVGEGLGSEPSVPGRIFAALGSAGISAEVLSQGASRINITMVLPEHDGPRAMCALYEA
ncbi:MAG: aspartate kinase, partial [Deltaproteobacteria bacterium]